MLEPADRSARVEVEIEAWLKDLVPRFLENRLRDVTILREALARDDFEKVRSLAHNLKGISGGYGFMALTEVGVAMERAALQRDREAIRASVDELADYVDRVDVVFK